MLILWIFSLSESFQVIVAIMFLLVLFQVFGACRYGENLSFTTAKSKESGGSAILDGATMEVRRLAGAKYNGTPIHALDDQEEHVDTYVSALCGSGFSYASECTSLTVTSTALCMKIMIPSLRICFRSLYNFYVVAGFLWGACSVAS